jgi:hypothetical protein
MNEHLSDVIVHINETLDEATIDTLEQGLRQDKGVVSVGHRPGQNHLLMVVYDADNAHPSSFVHRFQERGFHAQLVGM